MRDMISCEEVFEADANARAEFEAVCSAWQDEAIAAQEVELAAQAEREERERDLAMAEVEETCWCKFFESCSACFGNA